jgi:N-acetylglucosamine-6-sulfatase
MKLGSRQRLLAAITLTLPLLLAGCSGPATDDGGGDPGSARAGSLPGNDQVLPRPAKGTAGEKPNIVFVLMDDFSPDLLPTMRSAAAMRRAGATYDRSFVIDSLCCVSRASILTGQYPHQTGVRTNHADLSEDDSPMGGYKAFAAYGNDQRTFAVRLQQAGYTTRFVGKYLNQYKYVAGGRIPALPPGWGEFNALFASAYDGWGFHSSYVDDGRLRVRYHPKPDAGASDEVKDRSYAGTVIGNQALGFIDRHRGDSEPWFLEVAPYAPHSRVEPVGAWPGEPYFPAAFRDRSRPGQPGGNCGLLRCGALGVEDLRGLDDDLADNAAYLSDGTAVQPWVGHTVKLSNREIEEDLRDRARMVQSVDRLVMRILRQVPRNTYVVLTSDNGLHVGQHGLGVGKGAAYDSDIRVPLLVVGPGVRPGVRHQVVSNIDLAPTFEELGGLPPSDFRSGKSLVPTFTDPEGDDRSYAFVEHTWSDISGGPDQFAYTSIDMVPSYVAVRSRSSILIRYDLDPDPQVDEFAYEFYNYRTGFARTNGYALPRYREEVALLSRRLEEFDRCTDVAGNDPVPERCLDIRR